MLPAQIENLLGFEAVVTTLRREPEPGRVPPLTITEQLESLLEDNEEINSS